MKLPPSVQNFLDERYIKPGAGVIPGSWIVSHSITELEIDTTLTTNWNLAYTSRVDTWTYPLQFAANVASLDQAGVDHGSIGGLTDDDHLQYLTEARGDARYLPAAAAAALTVYGSGAAYSLTATSALLALGTTTPALTLTAAGTYLIRARVRLDYNAAQFATNQVVTLKLRRTNNTAADLADSSCSLRTGDVMIAGSDSGTMAVVQLPEVQYVTLNADDVIEIWGSIDVIPTAGSLDAVEASIVAARTA